MIILIKDSIIHSTYREISLTLLMKLTQQNFSFIEVPNDDRISFLVGDKSPLDQEINNSIKTEIRLKTAKLRRKIREETGILWGNSLYMIKPTTETLSNLIMAKSQFQQGNISRVPWRFDDGNFQELTLDNLDELIGIISKTIQENFSNERQEVMS